MTTVINNFRDEGNIHGDNEEVSEKINYGNRITVSHRHRGGRIQKINAWYLNTHMVYL